jgi:hypothetical protein
MVKAALDTPDGWQKYQTYAGMVVSVLNVFSIIDDPHAESLMSWHFKNSTVVDPYPTVELDKNVDVLPAFLLALKNKNADENGCDEVARIGFNEKDSRGQVFKAKVCKPTPKPKKTPPKSDKSPKPSKTPPGNTPPPTTAPPTTKPPTTTAPPTTKPPTTKPPTTTAPPQKTCKDLYGPGYVDNNGNPNGYKPCHKDGTTPGGDPGHSTANPSPVDNTVSMCYDNATGAPVKPVDGSCPSGSSG